MRADSSPTTRLLVAAGMLGRSRRREPAAKTDPADSAAFIEAYRAWINAHHVIEGDPDERMEKVRLMMLAMLGARDLGEALGIMLRFARLTFGDLSPVAIERVGEVVEIRLDRTYAPGLSGLIGELWPLALHLSQLEFLIGSIMPGVEGKIRSPAMLPAKTSDLIFDRPLHYGCPVLTLCIPRRALRRAIVATPAEVADFMPRLLPHTFERAAAPAELTTLVEALLRADALHGRAQGCDAASIAEKLGCGASTLRRRLAQEQASFRDIRTRVFDGVAKHWLAETRLPIGTIAARLGYVDDFSFRRAFLRANGCSPAAWRKTARDRQAQRAEM